MVRDLYIVGSINLDVTSGNLCAGGIFRCPSGLSCYICCAMFENKLNVFGDSKMFAVAALFPCG